MIEDIIGDRIQNLRQKMKTGSPEPNIDTFLVLIEENRRYLSGFSGEDGQYDESAGALLISPDACILATDSRYETQARQECPGYDVRIYQKGLAKELPEILKELKTRRLGFESRRLSYDGYKKIYEQLDQSGLSIDLIPTMEMVETLRLIKDESEIEAIRKAVHLAEEAFTDLIQTELLPGAAENHIAWELEKRMREAGAQSVSFPVITASGPNSALPHAIPSGRVFQAAEPLLFDWGARLDGYCSDMSRTVFLEPPNERLKKIYTTVYDAQQKAIDAIKPGKTTCEIDAIARSHIEEKGYKGYFGHGLGHGVGLAVHEPPSLSPVTERDRTIAENMVFTVEPGIYLPDKGGVRLENMVVVRSHGAEVFNHLPIRMDMTGTWT